MLAVVLSAAVLANCSPDGVHQMLGPSFSGASVPNCSYLRPPGFHLVGTVFGCNATITLGGSIDAAAAIQDGAAKWNTAFGHSADGITKSAWAPDVPRLRWISSGTPDVEVTMPSGSATAWCGGYSQEAPRILQFQKQGQGICLSSHNFGSKAEIALHELGHVLGYSTFYHHAQYGEPANCTMNLDPPPLGPQPAVNGILCQHEVEYILAAYGYGPYGARDTSNVQLWAFWGSHIITDLGGLPATKSVSSGGNTTLQVTGLGFASQSSPPGSGLSGVTFGWSADDGVISFAPSTGITTTVSAATGPATTTIRVKPTESSLPGTYRSSSRMAIEGATVAVTVEAPGGGGSTGGFTITEISGPPTPITLPEDVEFEATVNNPPGSPVYYRWQITASNGAFSPINVENTSPTRSLVVPGGSYNINVRVTPRVGTTTGNYREENWPVCTGGNLGMEAVPIGGGGTPDAKEGC